ncbi:amino acid transporter [Ilyonectria destructans]|nr:amino acid transporter [Ilyonectria destructans]
MDGRKDMKEASPTTELDVQTGQLLSSEGLQRQLGNRQIQLIAIGGSIGTGLFITIGNGLAAGGPASMLIAFTVYCAILACVNNCTAEMSVLHPVSGGFIRLSGKWVDDALGFMTGWNFFLYEALLIPFEITAICLILSYWKDDIPIAAVCAACIVLYATINVFAVGIFGEAEFWLSSGKVILIIILFFFTFITMVGGNPSHDAYGFRNWNEAGAFAEHRSTGDLGYFQGFLGSLWSAAFIIVGPEYISMASAETKRPRELLKNAFKTVYWRFCFFFIGSALFVGVVIPWNDPILQAVLHGESSAKGAAASPYIIAMSNMKIKVLPHIVNTLLITSVFSAGNTLTYCATRSLYSLALDGRAPRFLRKTTKNGVPIYAFVGVMFFPFLSFLQLSNNASLVLTWLVSLVTAGALINFFVICITYIQFYRACQAQGVDRSTFPYVGYFQPYCAYIGAISMFLITLFYGYSSLDPWNVEGFFQNYTMQILMPILFIGWKLIHKTKTRKPEEIDLVWETPIVDAYEAQFTEPAPGFWGEVLDMVTFGMLKREQTSGQA